MKRRRARRGPLPPVVVPPDYERKANNRKDRLRDEFAMLDSVDPHTRARIFYRNDPHGLRRWLEEREAEQARAAAERKAKAAAIAPLWAKLSGGG